MQKKVSTIYKLLLQSYPQYFKTIEEAQQDEGHTWQYYFDELGLSKQEMKLWVRYGLAARGYLPQRGKGYEARYILLKRDL